MDFSTISNTRCKLYAENANEPGILGLNVFGARKSSVTVANNKDIRKEAVMQICISIGDDSDDNLPHGLSFYDNTSGETNQTLQRRLRTPTSTETPEDPRKHVKSRSLEKEKGGVMLRILLSQLILCQSYTDYSSYFFLHQRLLIMLLFSSAQFLSDLLCLQMTSFKNI